MDHGIGMGPLPGLFDVGQTVAQMAGTGVTGLIIHKGLVRTVAPQLNTSPDLGLIVHLSASTMLSLDANGRELVCTVEEALGHGADAVSVHVNIGARTEGQMLADFAAVAERCHDLRVPLLAMVYARGPQIPQQFTEEFNILCARVGYEIGADLVKLLYTGDVASFRRVVRAVPIPVLIAGGPRLKTDQDVLQMVHESLQAGGAGVAIGRNVFGAGNVRGLCRALAALLHDNQTVAEASSLLQEVSS
jgi:class I fructose-bisphosphate aldolase